MNKAIKWMLITAGALVVMVVAAVIVVPMVVDVKQYKPRIESLVAEQTGRSFAMGDDIRLSVFPWVGVRLYDVTLGNAKGFKAASMVSVKSFEARLKVMPLLSKQIEVDSFVLDSPRIFLEKNKAGNGNWENIGPAKGSEPKAAADRNAQPGPSAAETTALPITSLTVGKFAIVNGMVSYADAASGLEKTVSDLNLELTEVSLDRPVKLSLKAMLDGKPLSVSGTAGPLGKQPGKENVNLDLAVAALDTLALNVKGTLILKGVPGLDAEVSLATFSPRVLFEKLGQPFPVQTRDPKVLDKVSFKAGIKGSPTALSLTGGTLVLDDSTLAFSADVKAFDKPDLRFDLTLDQMDADRYLPPAAASPAPESSGPAGSSAAPTGSASSGTASAGAPAPASPVMDYAPLRKMVLDGKASIGRLKVANLTLSNTKAVITGKNGIFNLDPLSMDLYQGTSTARAVIDVTGKVPATRVSLNTQGVQAGPLVRDGANKDIIEGTLAADIALAMTGDIPAQIRQSLGGKGTLTFTDGAIVGIDIAGTIRDAASGLGMAQKTADKPRTDFAELAIPFTADRGLVTIPGAALASPLLRLTAAGKTDLVKEELDFRIEPKLVATLKGQGDTKDRSGLLIPLLVKGTWADPKIRPDLEGMVKQKLSDPNAIKSLIEGKTGSGTATGSDSTTGSGESVEDKAKGLIKGLFN